MLLALLACTPVTEVPDGGFHVSGVVPEDGLVDVVEAQVPELRFSDPIDPGTCTPASLRLDAIHEDATVAFSMDILVLSMDGGYRVQLAHEEPMPGGWTYAISVRSDDDAGCTSVDGEPVHPFTSTFTVAP